MRSSNSKGKTNSDEGIPLENGLSQAEDGDEAHKLAAKLVDTVVKLAPDVADQRSRNSSPARTPVKLAELKKLPTIQIDTVPSPPCSPSESSSDEPFPPPPPPLDEEQIDIQLQEDEQPTLQLSEDEHLSDDEQSEGQLWTGEKISELTEEEKKSVKTFVELIIAEAMVVAGKKLKFVGLDENEDESHTNIHTEETSISNQEIPPSPEPVLSSEPEPEVLTVELEAEIRVAAEQVVEEVLTKAQETAADHLSSRDRLDLDFPGLPTFQIDTVKSAPPSPDCEEEMSPKTQTKWSFTMTEDSEDGKKDINVAKDTTAALITFDEAPDDVKDVASSLIKDIVGKAITMAEEKAVPTVPFNFDVDQIKASGPWYVRIREGFMRVLRSACFCTPRRNDS
ncbi:hypothetical protein JTE90_002362 [Oedothorax gibbosus]|uniref:Uncharacterized protein n=1 Tax=Oedothorax gibbosus TaxID=931172 RepID=A0AAV6TWA5_9ARAC|nr:hypothetical protein JTE90_002362 [Oedothorax gibbosus]